MRTKTKVGGKGQIRIRLSEHRVFGAQRSSASLSAAMGVPRSGIGGNYRAYPPIHMRHEGIQPQEPPVPNAMLNPNAIRGGGPLWSQRRARIGGSAYCLNLAAARLKAKSHIPAKGPLFNDSVIYIRNSKGVLTVSSLSSALSASRAISKFRRSLPLLIYGVIYRKNSHGAPLL